MKGGDGGTGDRVWRAPVVRHPHVLRLAQRPALPRPLHMLVVVASPEDQPPLDVRGEVDALLEIVQPLVETGHLAVEVLAPPTAQALRTHLIDRPCHLLHLVAHGGIDAAGGYLVLEDEERRSERCSAAAFCRLLGGRVPRFVLLNACLTAADPVRAGERGAARAFAGVAPALVQAGGTAVVAMQFPIGDRGAMAFSSELYRALVRGKPVDEAVDQARIAVTIEEGADRADWAAPVLFLRGRSGELFPGE